MIESRHIRLYPASQEQMEAFIAAEKDGDLKKAYRAMLDGCLQNPGEWEWHAMWMIELKDGTHIGDLCFKGLNPDGTAEIGYGILEEYRGKGYATEAVEKAVAWAFQTGKITAVEAETDPGNTASRKVLEKCGFVPNGKTGEEGPRYTLGL